MFFMYENEAGKKGLKHWALVCGLSTEFNPLIFQTLALKNVRRHARDLSRIYFRALHQDLSAGWLVASL